MRTEQLKYLVDVAETKSMSKTAERMFVSPQAVSKAIKQLELELDAELMVRTSTGIMLTPIGETVLERAKNMLNEEEMMSQAVAKSKQHVQMDNTFSIRICSTSAITNIALPEIIAQFSHMNINIIPRIYMVDSLLDVFEHVEKGLCDLGLLTYNEEELFRKFIPYQHVLDMDLLARDEQVVVMDRHLYEPGQEYVTVKDFQSRLRCMYCILPTETQISSAGDTHVMRSSDADFHRAMIKRADAYVLMPRLAYQHFFSSKSYVALPLQNIEVPMIHAAVYRKDTAEDLHRFALMIRLGLQ